jgi:CRP-like cAMP-binding protein/Fe-S-cluster-containing hydrogenase component 2
MKRQIEIALDVVEPGKPPGQRLSADELAAIPLFAAINKKVLARNEGAAVRRRYRKGDIICREGEFGSTAFLIEQGTVNVFLRSPIKHVRNQRGGLAGWFRRIKVNLVGRGEDAREEESKAKFIPIDAPVWLSLENPVASLTAGQMFGEMTCMSSYPRSATVQAAEDCTLIEMLRNMLETVQKNKEAKAQLDAAYRSRALESHLRSVPLFASLVEDEGQFARFVAFLRERVELVRLEPGDGVFKQGDAADHFYMVRTGFVKVAESRSEGEHVLNYIGLGGYFGEIGLLSNLPELAGLAPPGVRTATCSALDHVDLVRVTAADFLALAAEFPGVREQLVRVARERIAENEQARRHVADVSLGEFLRQGLMNAQSLLVLDLEKCTRCDECTKACADVHDGVTRLVREGLRFDRFLVTTSCRSCLDPYCMVGCPVGSIRRRNSREIIIEDWCIGCGKCAENCPYGNINMHPFPTGEFEPDPQDASRKVPIVEEKATTCDLCSELDGQPSCVYACPHDAAHRVSGTALLKWIER